MRINTGLVTEDEHLGTCEPYEIIPPQRSYYAIFGIGKDFILKSG
jgi:hypothetical protein